MGSKWKTKPLKDCATWFSGGTPRKSNPEFWNGNIPWISAKSLKDYFVDDSEEKITEEGLKKGSRLVPKDSILFVVRGMSLKNEFRMGITLRPVAFNQDLKALVAKDDILPHFLAYAIRGNTSKILDFVEEAGHGTGILPTERIQSIQIPDISFTQQEIIVHIIKSLDDKIELNRRMNATLEGLAQALFQSWFVDFDPVLDNALAAGNPIPDELTDRAAVRRQALDNGTANREAAQHFPATFQLTEELGWIPEGWDVSTIGEETETVGGGTPSTKNSEFWEGGEYPWVTPKDLSSLQDKVLLSSSRYLTDKGLKKISSGLLPVGTVLMSSRAPVGYLVITQIETAINQGFIGMKCNGKLPPEYVLQWANSIMDDIKRASSGSTFAEISKKIFRPFNLLVPSEETLNTYQEIVSQNYARITKNATENVSLANLRDTLLPQLISGKLRILDNA